MKSLLLALLLLAFGVGNARAQNQIVYDDALENGWQNYGWATLNYANTSPVHSGSDSISFYDPGTSYQALYLGHASFNPSAYQSLSFWIYPTAAGTNELAVQAVLNGNPQAAAPLSFTAAQVNHWQQITLSLSTLGVAGNAAFDGFWIQNTTGGPLRFYVDDISLIAVAVPNPVALSVDALNVVRTIDSRFYGMNLAIWDANLAGAATAPLLAAMGTGVIRCPGGSASDDYDWQTDQSVSNGSFQWVSNAATFAGVASAQNAQAYITVNYGSGTPEQAAAWVAYYNGSASNQTALGTDSMGRNWSTIGYWAALRGATPISMDDGYNFLRVSHPAPYGFHYWEIGNECYGSWENDLHGTAGSDLTGVAHDPYTYAQAFAVYYHEILAVDPTAHIGAVSIPGEDSYGIGTHPATNPNEGNSTHTGWTPVMLATLKTLGVTPHFLIHHNYYQNPGSESDAGLLGGGGASIVSDAANLRQMITDYLGGTAGAGIELAMTELNSVSSGPGKQTTSLVNGLYLADAIGNMAQTEINACTWWALRNGADTTANNSSSLYGWRPYGDYGVVASGDVSGTPVNTPFPSYYAAKLLAGWGRGGDRVVTATSAYALLSIYAAKLQNGNLALLVVNKHPTADLNAQITLSNFTPGSGTVAISSFGKTNDLSQLDLSTSAASIAGSVFTYTFPSYSMSVVTLKGEFEVWREANFTAAELSNWSYSGDLGQPAADGVPNLLKYAFGLTPTQSASASLPRVGLQTIGASSYLTLTFPLLSTLSDINYTVQVSSDLQTWQSGSANTVRVDNGATNTAVYRDLTPMQSAAQRFIRLSVTRP